MKMLSKEDVKGLFLGKSDASKDTAVIFLEALKNNEGHNFTDILPLSCLMDMDIVCRLGNLMLKV
jgi:hypothetical protein